VARPTIPILAADAAAVEVLEAAPRLVRVARRTAISYALWEGVDRTLGREKRVTDEARDLAAGYDNDCALMVVVRLYLLLDGDPKKVSFQRVYRHLKRSEVVTALRRRVRVGLRVPIYPNIRPSVRCFLKVYRAIDWEVHGRLLHFRNLGVAHLTSQDLKKQITSLELRRLVRSVVRMAECLEPFAPNEILLQEDEIHDWSAKARNLWRSAFRASHEDRLRRMNR
jgi:hypothetical protein